MNSEETRLYKFVFEYFRWKDLTTIQQFFRVRMFPGHHNFPSECSSQVLTSLKEDLNNILSISQIQ